MPTEAGPIQPGFGEAWTRASLLPAKRLGHRPLGFKSDLSIIVDNSEIRNLSLNYFVSPSAGLESRLPFCRGRHRAFPVIVPTHPQMQSAGRLFRDEASEAKFPSK